MGSWVLPVTASTLCVVKSFYIIKGKMAIKRYLIALCLVFAIVYVNATPEPVAEAEAEADADADAYYGYYGGFGGFGGYGGYGGYRKPYAYGYQTHHRTPYFYKPR